MSENEENAGPSAISDRALLEALLAHEVGPEGDWSMQEHGLKMALALCAEFARHHFNPAAINAMVIDEKHPMFARRFAPYNENGVRMSWNEQERRHLARMLTAREVLDEAKRAKQKTDAEFEKAQARMSEVETEAALLRLMLLLRAMQNFAKPISETGPLVTLMLALFGQAVLDDQSSTPELRAQTKRTYEVLSRRVNDEAFLHGIGHVIREFACRYDDEAGAEGRLSLAAASDIADRWLANAEAFEKFNEVLQGKGADRVDKVLEDKNTKPSYDEASSPGAETILPF